VGDRKPFVRFPLKLMKEELPGGDYHTQDDRRLFYVALTAGGRSADTERRLAEKCAISDLH